jgi:hypothetical protein
MQENVGIAVTEKAPVKLDLHAAQDQRATGDEPMRVVSQTDAKWKI